MSNFTGSRMLRVQTNVVLVDFPNLFGKSNHFILQRVIEKPKRDFKIITLGWFGKLSWFRKLSRGRRCCCWWWSDEVFIGQQNVVIRMLNRKS
uniref:Candidate secreted effector n=3 Tax=Meloidogyne incognita TaxID=6306 RepID=A0A914NZG0_MELIC